ncbi:Nop domain-containing protein [Cryphonectria parasitica EP155]|uniref:Nucleolar protein 58 n=1 Tax=Cryphonectria parasitica (strain ATCC 38755 / EP155) TaxID=660469 RepID=A0A9P4Y4D2_CRYP1|nr:Nop domain-containing protein [Cryphonectria parasitica EP155]KAF3766255.1 Nop domain-containing protein [Cryphonectria parasitica EP155]
MPLFVLSETSVGYALFKAKDKKLLDDGDLDSRLQSADKINNELKLKEIVKWDSAAQGLEEVAGLVEGKVTPMLTQLLESIKDEKKVSLAVSDAKLGSAINKLPQFNITPVADSSTTELYRNIRAHLTDLIPGLQSENIRSLALGLSHSLSRHKLRFSPDKVDVMIVQAISLLDDLDKELNTYAMRVKEWYGWHFPELGKILNDNLAYARVILAVGLRTNTSKTDLSDILPEEIETAVKAAAEVSMGTEISEEDLLNISMLADHVVRYTEVRQQLSSYLESRMKAIAPNLTELVGTLVGARLIAHAGSLMSLAKNPGSTIQILGAEKALFRALKTKHATPKYGLIYHSSLVGQATGKNKGKIARQLAAKTALGIRADALSEWVNEDGEEADEEERTALGVAARAKIENNLRRLEGRPLVPKGIAVGPNGQAADAPSKFDIKEARKYNIDADGLTGDEPAAAEPTPKKEKKDKKDKKEKKSKKEKPLIQEVDDEEMDDAPISNGTNGTAKTPKKLSEADYEKYAEAAGISVSKFKRKYERGDVDLAEDGTPKVLSKKELKKLKKAEEKEAGGKRKRGEDGEVKPKKKKKSKADA